MRLPILLAAVACVSLSYGQPSPMNDNFNGTSVNTTLWISVIDPANVGTISETNQRLEMLHTTPGVVAYQGLQSRCQVSGDFDVQVDFALLNWPSQNFHTVRFAAMDLPQGPFGMVGIYRNSYNSEGYQMRAAGGVVADIGAADAAGKLRLVRIGSTISGYYWNGTQFVLLAATATTTVSTRFALDFSSPNTSAPANIAIAFDNFIVNSGTATCPGGTGGTGQWVERSLSPTAPSARVGASLVYDPIRAVTVLFGGNLLSDSGFKGATDETWIWNGSAWNLITPPVKPPAMTAHSAVFDQAHGEMVVLSQAGGSTWAWNGSTWTLKSTQILPYGGSLAYDAARGEVILLDNLQGNTWSWNGSSWTQRLPSNSPPVRAFGSLAYDPIRSEVILFGGAASSQVQLNDTWSWNGTTWTQRFPANSPPPRQQQAATFDSSNGYMLLFGGIAGQTFPNDTWTWDGTNWSNPVTSLSPPAAPNPTLTFDSGRGEPLFFGDSCCFSNPSTWSSLWAWMGGATTGGTISVTTNLTSATFTITGPATYNGGGAYFTQPNAPPGQYTITYSGVNCFSTPPSETRTLAPGGSLAFTAANYVGEANLSVNIIPAGASSATFSISPLIPGMRNAGPYPVVQSTVWPQSYTVTFNPVSAFTTPSAQTLSPSSSCTVSFTGAYTPVQPSSTATLSVNTSIPSGFTISRSGTEIVYSPSTNQVQLPAPAVYTITYDNQARYYRPLPQTVMLNPGDSISLFGIYRRLILVTFTGFNDAPMASDCLSQSSLGGYVGSGIQYSQIDWNSPDRGMTTLLYEIQQNANLAPGAHMAAFTFYSTDGQIPPHQLGDACTPASDSPHTEAMSWITSQNVTPYDIVAVVGHSYGGNRARRVADDLSVSGLPVAFLATIDPIDWDSCNLLNFLNTVSFTNNPCDESSLLRNHSANMAQSFHQVLGFEVLGSLALPVKGYTLNSASVILRPDYHQAIDDDKTVHTTIINTLLDFIRGPQVTTSPGIPIRFGAFIDVPLQASVNGFGAATGITITSASLNGVPAINLASLGNVVAGNAGGVTLIFPGTASAVHSSATLTVNGTYSFGQTFTNTFGRLAIP